MTRTETFSDRLVPSRQVDHDSQWMRMIRRTFVMLVLGCPGVLAQEVLVSPHAQPPPPAIAAPVKVLIADGGAQVKVDRATITFWWVRSLPLKAGSTEPPAWSLVEEGTLVGAVTISAPHKDIRGRTLKPGSYTLRYGIQPANGDHLGVSPFREFLLLSPVSVDAATTATGHEGTIEMAKQTVGSSHPAVWSLDPPVATDNVPQVRTNADGHKAVIFQVPVERDGHSAGTLRFGVILVGKIEA